MKTTRLFRIIWDSLFEGVPTDEASIRQNYATLSDEHLKRLRPEELTDVARKALREELAARALHTPRRAA